MRSVGRATTMSEAARAKGIRLRPELRDHYLHQAKEAARLRSGRGAIEFERQTEIISRYLRKRRARVLDIGGGPGNYSIWLARQGYEPHLLDPVELHIGQALGRAKRSGLRIDARVGDARRLPYPSRYADAVLLMGPLYHLTKRSDRHRALCEARRVLRPGGVLIAVGISQFTSLLDGSWQGFVRDPTFRRIVLRDLQDGQHRNPRNLPAYFTTAFFAHPHALRREVADAGFASVELISAEGLLWWIPDILSYWRDKKLRRFLLAVTRKLEKEPSLIGLGPHFIVTGRKRR
jgi:ubiquinone/menaquinone biosynthesis C-methylase UbiE